MRWQGAAAAVWAVGAMGLSFRDLDVAVLDGPDLIRLPRLLRRLRDEVRARDPDAAYERGCLRGAWAGGRGGAVGAAASAAQAAAATGLQLVGDPAQRAEARAGREAAQRRGVGRHARGRGPCGAAGEAATGGGEALPAFRRAAPTANSENEVAGSSAR